MQESRITWDRIILKNESDGNVEGARLQRVPENYGFGGDFFFDLSVSREADGSEKAPKKAEKEAADDSPRVCDVEIIQLGGRNSHKNHSNNSNTIRAGHVFPISRNKHTKERKVVGESQLHGE